MQPELAFPTVLDRADRSMIRTEPFPHLVLQDAVPEAAFRALCDSFPDYHHAVSAQGTPPSNARYAVPAFLIGIDQRLPEVWRAFVHRHTAREWLRAVVAFWDGYWLDSQRAVWSGLDTATLGLALQPQAAPGDIQVDCRMELNTPTRGPATSVRGGHLDLPSRLFSTLLYMRLPDDDTSGGDLCLYRYRGAPPTRHLDRFAFDAAEVEVVATVPYRANTLVMFPNSLSALHGVSPRAEGPHERHYVFITAEVERDLF